MAPSSFSSKKECSKLSHTVRRTGRVVRRNISVVSINKRSAHPKRMRVARRRRVTHIIPIVGGLGRRFSVPMSVSACGDTITTTTVRTNTSLMGSV